MEPSIGSYHERRYSVDELLRMQTSLPVVACVVKRINKHPDIGGIFRLPDEAFRHPDRFSCETRKLADTTNKPKIQQFTKRQMGQSSEESEHYTKSESSTNRELRQLQWSLRRRESSDRSSQPHSAPSGLAAQQSENFQRFYRAVVSPTHVRVTAGGRIVPNTRVTAPPAFEWNAERLHFEPKNSSQDELNNIQSTPWPQNTPLPAGYPPLVPNGLLPPYGFLQQGSSLGLSVMAHQVSGSFSIGEPKPFEGEQMSKINGEPGALPQPIKISPPTQFDQTKPFVYNGHLVYPVPQGFQPPPNALPVPITMLRNPSFLQGPSPSPAGFFSPQLPMPMASIPNSFVFPQGQQLPMPMQSAGQEPESLTHVPSYTPLPGMMPVSELTRSQIQGLCNHLKFIDNQIANNKHQIDETYMLSQRAAVQTQIDTMEGILEVQLRKEGNGNTRNRGEDSTDNGKGKSSSSGGKKVILASRASASPPKAQQPASVMSSEQTQKAQTVKLEEAHAQPKPGETKSRAGSLSKSRLSAAAAMAPPFQPRAQAVVSQPKNLTGLATDPPTEPARYESQGKLGASPLTKSIASCGQDNQAPKVVAHSTLSRAHSLHASSIQRSDGVQTSSFQRSNTFHGQTAALEALTTTSIISPQAVPYLVGILPTGVQASDATPHDLVYSRPLTDEEVRARYLYWGKAPRHIQSGLPKFDGKDFYPPSPVKENVHLATTNQATGSRYNARPLIPNFEDLFTEPGVPGYKTPSPVRPAASLQHMVAVSTQPFAENGTGHRSLQRQTFTSDRSASGPTDWETRNSHNDPMSHQPMTPPSAITNGNYTGEEDYSALFLERGVPGYKSPSPSSPQPAIQQTAARYDNGNAEIPVTPRNFEAANRIEHDETTMLNPWIPPTAIEQWIPGKSDIPSPVGNEAQSDTSTVEIHLTPQNRNSAKRRCTDAETTFAERVANFNSEQQTLFLQNMLKNTATMSGPALSGGVSSATAQGYLPQYRGFAAASLSPTVLNVPGFERDLDHSVGKTGFSKDTKGAVANINAANTLPENRPLSRAIPIIRPAPEALDAEGYMRYLKQKAEDDKKAMEQGWNTNTTGRGPVMGSDW